MSRKRGGDGSLTGGSGDVNPQYLNSLVTQTGADTFTQVTIPVPVPRFSQRGERATVMEVLQVTWNHSPFTSAAAGFTVEAIRAALTTKSFAAAPVLSEGTCFWMQEDVLYGAFTAAGSAFAVDPDKISTDQLDDGAGHGILVATDNIYLSLASAATAQANTAWIKILYRFKEVSLSEYIGIVQSQQ